MCCYKLERSASEDAQQLVSANKNLHHEFLRLPVIQVFRKPVQNPWFIKELSVLMNNVLNNLLHLFKTFYELSQYFCCYVTSIVMCNMSMFLCLCSFIMQNLILQYLFSQWIFLCAWSFAWQSRFCVSALALFLKSWQVTAANQHGKVWQIQSVKIVSRSQHGNAEFTNSACQFKRSQNQRCLELLRKKHRKSSTVPGSICSSNCCTTDPVS